MCRNATSYQYLLLTLPYQILPFTGVLHFAKFRCSAITLVFNGAEEQNMTSTQKRCIVCEIGLYFLCLFCIFVFVLYLFYKMIHTVWHIVCEIGTRPAPVIGDWGNGRGRIPLIRSWSEDVAKFYQILNCVTNMTFIDQQMFSDLYSDCCHLSARQRYGQSDILLISKFGKNLIVEIWPSFDSHHSHHSQKAYIQKIGSCHCSPTKKPLSVALIPINAQPHKSHQDLQCDNGFFNHFTRQPIKKNSSHTHSLLIETSGSRSSSQEWRHIAFPGVVSSGFLGVMETIVGEHTAPIRVTLRACRAHYFPIMVVRGSPLK